jgi:hypothetical protein
MKFLFPHRYRRIGWILILPTALLLILDMYFEIDLPFLEYVKRGVFRIWDANWLFNLQSHNFTREVASVLFMVGLLMAAFSKEKQEDERTIVLRLESLLWSVYVNVGLVILAIILFYDLLFLQVMVYNLISTLVIFIARYSWVMYKDRRAYEK